MATDFISRNDDRIEQICLQSLPHHPRVAHWLAERLKGFAVFETTRVLVTSLAQIEHPASDANIDIQAWSLEQDEKASADLSHFLELCEEGFSLRSSRLCFDLQGTIESDGQGNLYCYMRPAIDSDEIAHLLRIWFCAYAMLRFGPVSFSTVQ